MSKIPLFSIVDRKKKFRLMNGNSRREFVLNSLASNVVVAIEGEEQKRYLFTMRLDTLDVYEKSWYINFMI